MKKYLPEEIDSPEMIKEMRLSANQTQEQAALLLGLNSRVAWGKWERGKQTPHIVFIRDYLFLTNQHRDYEVIKTNT